MIVSPQTNGRMGIGGCVNHSMQVLVLPFAGPEAQGRWLRVAHEVCAFVPAPGEELPYVAIAHLQFTWLCLRAD